MLVFCIILSIFSLFDGFLFIKDEIDLMCLRNYPLAEINHKATEILFEQMGVVNMLKFLSKFSVGYNDYTQERHQWLDELDNIIHEMKANKANRE